MESINASMANVMSNVISNARNYTITGSVLLVIIFFADLNAHPYMKSALIVFAAVNFLWYELQFDASLVAINALNQDALALGDSSNYAKKYLSAPVKFQRPLLLIVMAGLFASQLLVIANY